jgi:hypothetical protein
VERINFYKKIIKLRRESLALRRGNFKCLYQQGGLYCFSRQLNEEKIVVALNNSDKNEEIKILLPEIETGKRLKVKDVFTGVVDPLIINQNEPNLKVAAHDFRILSVSFY